MAFEFCQILPESIDGVVFSLLHPLFDVTMLNSFLFLGIMSSVHASRGLRTGFLVILVCQNNFQWFIVFLVHILSLVCCVCTRTALCALLPELRPNAKNFLGVETTNSMTFLSQSVGSSITVACRNVRFVDAY